MSDELYHEIRCPITMCIFKDPVITSDGHTYEKHVVNRLMKTTKKSPMTSEIITSMLDNEDMKKLVEQHLIDNPQEKVDQYDEEEDIIYPFEIKEREARSKKYLVAYFNDEFDFNQEIIDGDLTQYIQVFKDLQVNGLYFCEGFKNKLIIEGFEDNIEFLFIDDEVNQEIDLSKYKNLIHLDFGGEFNKTIDLSKCEKLEYLEFDCSDFNQPLNLTKCKNLKYLDLSYTPYSHVLDLSNCLNLEFLDLSEVPFDHKLDLSNNKKLKYFRIDYGFQNVILNK